MLATKNFLVITHAYPPMGGGGVQRIVKFVKYLKEYGWTATVVCPTSEYYSWIDNERLKEVGNIDVIRVPIDPLRKGLVSKIVRKLKFIDPFMKWSKNALKRIDKEDLTRFELVFTSGPPHSVHYVGYQLKKRNNLKWVSDFRDHYTLGPEYRPISLLHDLICRLFEKRIYKYSDKVITNTQINRGEVLSAFSGLNGDKIKTIYNGFDKDDMKICESIDVLWDKEKLNLIYLGGLRGDHVDGVFYRIVEGATRIKPSLMNEIKIYVIGDISRKGSLIHELGLESIFVYEDAVPYNQVGNYLAKASGALTWQPDKTKYKGTIAGKVFDYLGMKLPIFSIGQDDGEIANIINKYDIGVSACPQNMLAASHDFIRFCDNLRLNKYTYDRQAVDDINMLYNRKNQAMKVKLLFEDIYR